MPVNIARATKQISDLSLKTLAAGHVQVAGYGQRKLAAWAEEEQARVLAAAQSDLVQCAMERWLELLYDCDGNVWYNVRFDGMIQLAPPWSRSRRKQYGLTEPMARLLALYTQDLIGALPARRRLYVYLPAHQRYGLNRESFPTFTLAREWQQTVGRITPAAWRSYQVRYPGGRRQKARE
jgi:hypothetical protein